MHTLPSKTLQTQNKSTFFHTLNPNTDVTNVVYSQRDYKEKRFSEMIMQVLSHKRRENVISFFGYTIFLQVRSYHFYVFGYNHRSFFIQISYRKHVILKILKTFFCNFCHLNLQILVPFSIKSCLCIVSFIWLSMG